LFQETVKEKQVSDAKESYRSVAADLKKTFALLKKLQKKASHSGTGAARMIASGGWLFKLDP